MSHHPHDRLVGKLLKDKSMAIDLFKSHLPAGALDKLDLSTLKASSETAVDEKWKKLHNDIVFHCKMKDRQDAYLYLLIEHQSTPDPLMPARLLRYKMNLLGKYLDAKNKPAKLPNILSLVLYHGEKAYPYHQDLFACFEDEALAREDLTAPMLLIDLTDTPEEILLHHGGADALLKLLLKYSREKDFVNKVQSLMEYHREIFVTLSVQQASFVFEYVLLVGKGNPTNAKVMKAAMDQIYGAPQTEKFFSLADYLREERIKKIKIAEKQEMARQMLTEGMDKELIARVTRLPIAEIDAL